MIIAPQNLSFMLARYFVRLGTAFSTFLNVLLGGPSHQTLSARNFERKLLKKWHVCWFINWLLRNPTHCTESYIWWATRKDVLAKKIYELENHKRMWYERKKAVDFELRM